VSVIKGCLDRFCEASGKTVSFAKSVVHFSKNVRPQLKEDIRNELGISTVNDLEIYLHMLAIHGKVTEEHFNTYRIGLAKGWQDGKQNCCH